MSNRQRLCACGCGIRVTRRTERRHESGQGPALLTSKILAQNRALLRSTQKRFRAGQRKSPLPSTQQHPHPDPRTVASRNTPSHGVAPATDLGDSMLESLPRGLVDELGPLQTYPGDNEDFEARPSGINRDVAHPSPQLEPSHNMHSTSHHSLNLRRSSRIAERVARIGQRRWGSNHVLQFIVDDKESDDESDGIANEKQVEEDYFSDKSEDDFEGDEDEMMLGAEPWEVGISEEELLGEDFLKETSQLGEFIVY